jgi:hypothetical protein
MTRSEARALLPAVYALALEFQARGLGPGEISARLEVEVAAVGPLLEVARAKLAALEAREVPADSTGDLVRPWVGADPGSRTGQVEPVRIDAIEVETSEAELRC